MFKSKKKFIYLALLHPRVLYHIFILFLNSPDLDLWVLVNILYLSRHHSYFIRC